MDITRAAATERSGQRPSTVAQDVVSAVEPRSASVVEEPERGVGADRRAAAAPSARIDVQKLRADFPILGRTVNGKPLVYLDNAATTQKPRAVLDAIESYYAEINANVHRGVHELSGRA